MTDGQVHLQMLIPAQIALFQGRFEPIEAANTAGRYCPQRN
jgi:hypothetical protein